MAMPEPGPHYCLAGKTTSGQGVGSTTGQNCGIGHFHRNPFGSLPGNQTRYALLSRRSVRDDLRGTMVGKTLSCTVSLVTTTLATSSRLGVAVMRGSRDSSLIR